MEVCPACGTESADGAKFCRECAAPLALARPAAAQERKTVTVLFCDVSGSTALGERLDAEAMRSVMTRYFAEMSRVVQAHGGTVEKFIGDAVVAVFGLPVVHEDDALRALRAAAGMTVALDGLNADIEARHGVRLAARIGVNTGEVVVGGGEPGKGTVATGDAVNVAARLEQAASPGETLFGAATYALVRDHVDAQAVPPLALKGKSLPVDAWLLRGVPSLDASLRSPQEASPLVGRGDELLLVRQAFARSVHTRRPQLVTVLGAAGVGKTRLLTEALAGLGATVLSGRCLSYGDDIVFWPLREMLRTSAGIEPGDGEDTGRARLLGLFSEDPDGDRLVERLAPLAGLPGTPAEADETQWAVRRLVETLGRRGPVVLAMDDVHWAEPALLDVIDHLADWTRDTPLLIVCLARPELLDGRPQWAGGKVNASTVLLEPLAEADAGAMLANLRDAADLDAPTRHRILAAAGGMPLYVEQMMAMLAEDRFVPGSGSTPGGHGGTPTVEVPPTIAALLGARLDRLTAAERAVLEAAAAVGTTFYRGAVAELAAVAPQDVPGLLRSLTRKELVRPDTSELPGEDGFRFLHALVREAAYAGISKSRRSELHERFARWLDKRAAAQRLDVDDFVGYHLEQAVRFRRELGDADAATGELAADAARRLGAHGRRLAAADPVSAASLHDRAADLVRTGSPEQLDHLRHAAEAITFAGDFPEAQRRYAAALRAARAAGDDRQATLAELAAADVSSHVDPAWDAEAHLPVAERALRRFREVGDDEGMLVAGVTALNALNELCRWAPMIPITDDLLPAAERLDDQIHRNELLQFNGMALFYGPAPIDDLLAHQRVDPPFTSRMSLLGHVYGYAAALAMADRPDEARTFLGRADSLLAETTNPVAHAMAAFGGSDTLVHLGDLDAAERMLRRGVEALQEIGERTYRSSLAVLLGEVRLALGDPAEARRWVELGRDLTSSKDVLSQASWRSLLARVEAADGRPGAALTLADEAVRLIEQADDMTARARTHEGRAEVLAMAGRHGESVSELQVALTLYRDKGDRVCAQRLRSLIADSDTVG